MEQYQLFLNLSEEKKLVIICKELAALLQLAIILPSAAPDSAIPAGKKAVSARSILYLCFFVVPVDIPPFVHGRERAGVHSKIADQIAHTSYKKYPDAACGGWLPCKMVPTHLSYTKTAFRNVKNMYGTIVLPTSFCHYVCSNHSVFCMMYGQCDRG